MSYFTQSMACSAPNGMGPLTDYEASLLAAPPGSKTSYLPPAAPGSPGYVASPSSTAVTPLQNGTAGAPPSQAGPNAQCPNQPFYTSNYPDSTARLVNSLNPFQYLYGGGGATCGSKGIPSPNWKSRKRCSPQPVRRDQLPKSNGFDDSWPWWLLGIGAVVLIVGLPR